MPKHKKLSLIKRLSWPGWQGWVFIGITLAAVGASLTTLPETIEKNKLKNYYHNALTFYADTSGNGKIESEEENRFIQDFVSEIRQKPGYDTFNLRSNDINNFSASPSVLALLRQYRPIPPF